MHCCVRLMSWSFFTPRSKISIQFYCIVWRITHRLYLKLCRKHQIDQKIPSDFLIFHILFLYGKILNWWWEDKQIRKIFRVRRLLSWKSRIKSRNQWNRNVWWRDCFGNEVCKSCRWSIIQSVKRKWKFLREWNEMSRKRNWNRRSICRVIAEDNESSASADNIDTLRNNSRLSIRPVQAKDSTTRTCDIKPSIKQNLVRSIQ